MFTLFSYNLDYLSLVLIFLTAILTGMSKTGVHGAGMLSVPLLALVFGGQNSSGAMLPMLVLADIIGVWYYHRHASWKHLKLLFPWAALGIVAGTIIGKYINDDTFRLIMAITIVLSVIIMLWLRKSDKKAVPHNGTFARLTGIAGGFTSMVGNLAGSVMAVYFLAARLPKNVFICTTAWFFLVVNWFKVPFHVFSWHTITLNTFLLALCSLPGILIGAVLGIFIVRRISEKNYRWFIIIMTVVAAFFMVY